MTKSITNSDNIIDSHDVIARIGELESDLQDLEDTVRDAHDALANPDNDQVLEDELEAAMRELDVWNESEEGQELQALKNLAQQAENYASDWQYGVMLINGDYFEQYAKQLAKDIGAINDDVRWPSSYIDWKAAAEELKQDYTELDFDGTAFYVHQ